jgi:hypothetical protein
MILYNVTINIEPDVEEEWIHWMKNKHIVDVMNTGHFVEFKFLKLLQEDPEAQGNTYAVQYFAEDIGKLETYLNTDAPALQKEHMDKYSNKFVAFRTVLQEV